MPAMGIAKLIDALEAWRCDQPAVRVIEINGLSRHRNGFFLIG